MIWLLALAQLTSTDIQLSPNQIACQAPSADDTRPYTLCVAEADFQDADKEMNRQWAITVRHVKLHKGAPAARRLRAKQRKWITDRERRCEKMSAGSPVTQQGRDDMACQEKLTVQRTLVLKTMVVAD